MKRIVFTVVLGMTLLQAGFFNEEAEETKRKYEENERLCKLFLHKAEKYKKHMRDDVLARTTLASYIHRAELFCKRAKDLNATLAQMGAAQ